MSKTQESAQLINKAAIEVDSMASLIAVEVWDGRKVDLSGFYADTPFGFKRQFTYDASQAKTGHDGWSIINPDHLSTIGSANWYSSTGDSTDDSGSGCWVRDVEGGIYIEEAGGQAGSDCTDAVTAIVSAGQNWIRVGKGTYQLDNYGNPSSRTLLFTGTVTEESHIEAVTDYSFNITQFGEAGEGGIRFDNIVFSGAGKTKNGIYIDIRKNIRTNHCVFSGCVYGIRKNAAFGDKHYDTTFTGNDYGVYAEGVAGEGHVGFDKYVSCLFRTSALAGVYKEDGVMGEGGLDLFIGCQFEPNQGFDLFYLNSESTGDVAKTSRLINCWFESASRGSSVTINGASYTPRNIMLDNSNMSIEGGNLRDDVEIRNGSYLKARNTFLFTLINDGHEDNVLDLDYLVGDNHNVDYPVKHLVSRRDNREATSLDVTNRPNLVTDKVNKMVGGSGVYDTLWEGNGTHTVTQVEDGLFPENICREIDFADATGLISPGGDKRPGIVQDKWYVITIALKKMSGTIDQLQLQWEGGGGALTTQFKNLPSEWKTYKTIFKGGYTDASEWLELTPDAAGVVRYSKAQLIEFDTKSEAVDFTGSSEYVLDETYHFSRERGTYEPTLTPSGSGSITLDSNMNTLSYTVINGLVFVQGRIGIDSVSSPTGRIGIDLPIPGLTGETYHPRGEIVVHNAVSANAADFVLWGQDSEIRVFLGDAASLQTDSAEEIQATSLIQISFQYYKA